MRIYESQTLVSTVDGCSSTRGQRLNGPLLKKKKNLPLCINKRERERCAHVSHNVKQMSVFQTTVALSFSIFPVSKQILHRIVDTQVRLPLRRGGNTSRTQGHRARIAAWIERRGG